MLVALVTFSMSGKAGPSEEKKVFPLFSLFCLRSHPRLTEAKEAAMSRAKVCSAGSRMTRTHLARSRQLLRLSCTPLTTPLTSSSTFSWSSWLTVRSTIQRPNLGGGHVFLSF